MLHEHDHGAINLVIPVNDDTADHFPLSSKIPYVLGGLVTAFLPAPLQQAFPEWPPTCQAPK